MSLERGSTVYTKDRKKIKLSHCCVYRCVIESLVPYWNGCMGSGSHSPPKGKTLLVIRQPWSFSRPTDVGVVSLLSLSSYQLFVYQISMVTWRRTVNPTVLAVPDTYSKTTWRWDSGGERVGLVIALERYIRIELCTVFKSCILFAIQPFLRWMSTWIGLESAKCLHIS